jgi:hypothetical protein
MSHLYDVSVRFWDELISRPSGPLAFRFILQPVMASALAIRDGIKDAQASRTPYLWTILHDPSRRGPRLHEGVVAVSRVLILGVMMDLAYQIVALHGLRPVELVVVVFALAFVPYLLVRGPAERVTRLLIKRQAGRDETHSVQRG